MIPLMPLVRGLAPPTTNIWSRPHARVYKFPPQRKAQSLSAESLSGHDAVTHFLETLPGLLITLELLQQHRGRQIPEGPPSCCVAIPAQRAHRHRLRTGLSVASPSHEWQVSEEVCLLHRNFVCVISGGWAEHAPQGSAPLFVRNNLV